MTSARPVGQATPLSLAVTTVILAVLLGGVPGALIVLTAAIETQGGRRRAPAATALGLLALAALATVWGAPLTRGSVNLDYALDRPVAAAAGRLAGVAMLVAVAVAAAAERVPVLATATTAPPSRNVWTGLLKERVRLWNGGAALATVASAARAGLPYLIPAAVVVAAVALRGPLPLEPPEARLAHNVEMGQGYLAPEVAPLGPLVAVAVPVSAEVALLAVTVLTVVAAVGLARRLGVRSRAATGAGVAAAVVTGAAGQGLTEALATLLVTTGLVWVSPARISNGRAAMAGLCLGGAALARPQALLVVVAATVWLVADLDDWRRVTVPSALMAGSSLVVLWPWLRWLHLSGDLGWSILAGDPGGTARWAAPVLAVLVVVLVTSALASGVATRYQARG